MCPDSAGWTGDQLKERLGWPRDLTDAVIELQSQISMEEHCYYYYYHNH